MLKQLMLSKKIEQAREVLNGYLEEETKFKTRSEQLATGWIGRAKF
mgnify:CR=1 FL=1